jgi:hypothetical protein
VRCSAFAPVLSHQAPSGQGFRKRTRADGGSARYLHWEAKPAFTAKNRYALPPKMLIPKDFDFSKQLSPFFPVGASQSHSMSDPGASGSQHRRRDQHNSDGAAGDAAAGDGAAHSLTKTTSEPETQSPTGEQQKRNDRQTKPNHP